jgi:hypothetical protein
MALRTSSSARAGVGDLALAHAAGAGLADADDVEGVAALISPTTTQIFEVPISNPTMMEEESNIFPFRFIRFDKLVEQRAAATPPATQRTGKWLEMEMSRVAMALPSSLAVVVNVPPAAQLDIKLVERKSDARPLAGGRLQNFRRGDIDALQLDHPGHGGAVQLGQQAQGGENLGGFGLVAGVQILGRHAGEGGQERVGRQRASDARPDPEAA